MIILGIETSCDETAAAVLERKGNRITILSNVVASSASLQEKFGGIIPEQAAREQIKAILPVIQEALAQAFPDYQLQTTNSPPIDAIAVTYGPGLIGSLLVGVETAKTLSLIWNKPLIPINHLLGHFYANWITLASLRGAPATKQSRSDISQSRLPRPFGARNDNFQFPKFPCIGLLVSGGHTDLVLFTSHGKYKYLGGTRDDAAGECFDKCARLLGLPYPGGPQISKLAEKGNPNAFNLPRPMMDEDNFDFSFSGLKTAAANLLHTSEVKVTPKHPSSTSEVNDVAASIEAAIVEVLVSKTIKAAMAYKVKQIIIAGGVAANQRLVNRLEATGNSLGIKIHVPPPNLCTDNGAMIAAAAFFQKPVNPPAGGPLSLQANPNLSLS